MEERSDRFTAIEDQYADYTVVDEGGSKIGKVDDLFLDENEVRSYYGLGPIESSGSYGDYEETNGHSGAGTTDSTTAGTVGSGMSMGDTETGEFREHDRNQESLSQPGSDLLDEDELRRSEEELLAGTREREAGSVKVRKR